MSDAKKTLLGTGNHSFQGLVLIGVIVVVLRAFGLFGGSGDGGTFRAESSHPRPVSVTHEPVEGDDWGGVAGKTAPRDGLSASEVRARLAAEERRRKAASTGRSSHNGTPIYDPAADGGWGSN